MTIFYFLSLKKNNIAMTYYKNDKGKIEKSI